MITNLEMARCESLDSRESFQSSHTEPFLQIAFRGARRLRERHLSANRLARIASRESSCESPGHLRSKILVTWLAAVDFVLPQPHAFCKVFDG